MSSEGGGSCPLGFGKKFARCPFGFGGGGGREEEKKTKPFKEDDLERMSLSSLRGASTDRHLLSLKGIIYDVGQTDNEGLLRPFLNHEVSRLFACSSLRLGGNPSSTTDNNPAINEDLLDQGLAGISYDQVLLLEKIGASFQSQYKAIAILMDKDELFNTSGSLLKEEEGAKAGREGGGGIDVDALGHQLHSLIEQGQADELRLFLQEVQATTFHGDLPQILEYSCLRTGMTPLHKAVEARSFGMSKSLIESGASLTSKAALYDNDNAVQLAHRLHCDEELVALLEKATI